MEKKDFSNLGDQIKSSVQDAVDSLNLDKIGKNIEETLTNALDEVGKSIQNSDPMRKGKQINKNNGANQAYQPNQNNRPKNASYESRYNQPAQPTQQNQLYQGSYQYQMNVRRGKGNALISKRPVGRVSGVLLTIFGFIGVGIMGTLSVILGIIALIGNTVALFGEITFGLLLPLLAISICMASRGVFLRKRVNRFRKYTRQLNGRNYCSIKQLASHIGQSDKFVVKDLKKMIRLGMFPEGHIDEQHTCLMLNYETYQQYTRSQEDMKRRQEEENQRKQQEERFMKLEQQRKDEQQKNEGPQAKEVRKVIQYGRDYIYEINEINKSIPDEEISKKLYRLEEVTSKIFTCVEDHPEQINEIQKFMDYYLPTTLKLVKAYKEFDSQPVKGENITSAQKEIKHTLDTINLAFETLLDSLFQEAAMDISTDISVLKTVLAQEGLTQKDFDTK